MLDFDSNNDQIIFNNAGTAGFENTRNIGLGKQSARLMSDEPIN
jgi:hypothetical protein